MLWRQWDSAKDGKMYLVKGEDLSEEITSEQKPTWHKGTDHKNKQTQL